MDYAATVRPNSGQSRLAAAVAGGREGADEMSDDSPVEGDLLYASMLAETLANIMVERGMISAGMLAEKLDEALLKLEECSSGLGPYNAAAVEYARDRIEHLIFSFRPVSKPLA